jgi:hypothetical protein
MSDLAATLQARLSSSHATAERARALLTHTRSRLARTAHAGRSEPAPSERGVIARVIVRLLTGPSFAPVLAALIREESADGDADPASVARRVTRLLRHDRALVAGLLDVPREEIEALAAAALEAEGFVRDTRTGAWRAARPVHPPRT